MTDTESEPTVTDAEVEAAARAMAKVDGRDPDEPAWVRYPGPTTFGIAWRDHYAEKARAALTAALAARPKQEPVAWLYRFMNAGAWTFTQDAEKASRLLKDPHCNLQPLYAAPLAASPELARLRAENAELRAILSRPDTMLRSRTMDD